MIANRARENIKSVSIEQRILKDLDASLVKPLTASPALKHLVIPSGQRSGKWQVEKKIEGEV